MFIARKSNHIEADIKRNWSSWNFGEDGFSGTYSYGKGIFGAELSADNLNEAIAESLEVDYSGQDYSGQGVRFDATKAVLIYSKDNIHIFEV